MDDQLLLGMLIVFCTVTLVLLIRVEWRDWGLVGLLLLCAGISALMLRVNLPRVGIHDGQREMLWLWRAGAFAGGLIVVSGLAIEFYRSTPPWKRIMSRLLLGGIAAGLIVGLMNLFVRVV